MHPKWILERFSEQKWWLNLKEQKTIFGTIQGIWPSISNFLKNLKSIKLSTNYQLLFFFYHCTELQHLEVHVAGWKIRKTLRHTEPGQNDDNCAKMKARHLSKFVIKACRWDVDKQREKDNAIWDELERD